MSLQRLSVGTQLLNRIGLWNCAESAESLAAKGLGVEPELLRMLLPNRHKKTFLFIFFLPCTSRLACGNCKAVRGSFK